MCVCGQGGYECDLITQDALQNNHKKGLFGASESMYELRYSSTVGCIYVCTDVCRHEYAGRRRGVRKIDILSPPVTIQ